MTEFGSRGWMHATPEYGPAAAPQPAITAVEVTTVPFTSGGDRV